MKFWRRFMLIGLFFPVLSWSEQYLCIPDEMTGFSYNAKTTRWEITKFRVNFKYVISKPADGKNAFVITEVGKTQAPGYCEKGFNDAGMLFCVGADLGDFKFNRTNGRYLAVFDMGYYLVGKGIWAETDADSGTPAMQIGKCTPF
jgi:hypothetical protein